MNAFQSQEYARPDGLSLLFDLYHPGGGVAPLVVFIHGGGWISGEREMYSEECEWFAERGFATATIDYRLAPLYPFPASIADVQSFLRFVRSEGTKFGIDPDRIGAMGNSAGGHLASMLGVSRTAFDGGASIRANAVVDVCGLTDMRNPMDTQYPISMSFIEQFLGGHYLGREADYALASPLTHVDRECCPFLIVHGTLDDVVPPAQSEAMHNSLTEQGVRSSLMLLEGEGHSFSFEAWDRVRTAAVDFFNEVLHAR